MENPLKDHYDNIYSSAENVFGGGLPEEMIVRGLKLLNRDCKALEIGAGQGRNSLYIAEQGLEVTAIDLSKEGIEKIIEFAKNKGLKNLKAEVKSATDEIEGNFDLIVSTFMLRHLKREEALFLIEKMKSQTNSNGLNILTAFTKNGDFYQNNPGTGNFYPEENELRELYKDWEIIEYEEKNSTARKKNTDGSAMYNIKANLIARKY